MSIESIQIAIVLCILLFVFIAFVKESFPPDVISLSVVAVLLITGILTSNEVLTIFSNPGPITVGAMFVLTSALERTGCIHALGQNVVRFAKYPGWVVLFVMMFVVMFLSAFMNNTPIVVMMAPVVIVLARSMKVSAKQFLIPLSYAAILGGTCTLIGTSTNLLVDGLVQSAGLPAFSVFEITGFGSIVATIGALYVVFVGRHFLPKKDDDQQGSSFSDRTAHFFTEVLVTKKSGFVNKTLKQAGFPTDRSGKYVIDVIRQAFSLRYDLANLKLQAGDRIVLETNMQELMDLKANKSVAFEKKFDYEEISSQPAIVMQAIVGPRSRYVGKTIGELNLSERYGCYILAVHRHEKDYDQNFEDVRLAFGDTILLEGPKEKMHDLFIRNELISISDIEEQPYRRDKAWIAIGAILSVILFSSIAGISITSMAIIACVLVLLLGCMDTDEAYQAIDWRIIFMIFGMIALSMALEKTGAAVMIVNKMLPFFEALGPFWVLALVYGVVSFLTEMISNNAVALLFTPIALSIADQMGVDARPFIVAVMFGASASFATPIGYQTNTFVYSAGGYKFMDFLKIGTPINILLFLVSVFLIPYFWPF